ncbi:hypothetical protein DEDE109153_09080 [Deinococcus deserti]|uniref:Uncharacterized protein n=1 Tax=Deinococcus deserti (strain DSM 17065 / CIP 109153 / LMG 22923 / VCD115) TaxID=546414 RepID=C1D447_DEIDV|nr:hypothetical protein [Deinococcus deserti]ACO47928.1 Hypothetical protein, precursor [Deinococcus deserti VCD115]
MSVHPSRRKQWIFLPILWLSSFALAEVQLVPVPASDVTRLLVKIYSARKVPADMTFVALLLRQQPSLAQRINSMEIDVESRTIRIGVSEPLLLKNDPVLDSLREYAHALNISMDVTAVRYFRF